MDSRRRPLHLPRLPRRARYRVWSISTITAYGLVVAGLTAGLVFWLGKRSLFFETELTLAIIAAALFAFLATGLYAGVRVRRKDLPQAQWPDMPSPDFQMPDLGNFDLPDGGDEGCLGAVVGLVLTVVVGILLLFVLWVLVYLGVVLWVFLLVALAWIFYLALRQVFAKSRICRGDAGRSLGYALLYTVLYTGWLFALVFIADGLMGGRLRARPAGGEVGGRAPQLSNPVKLPPVEPAAVQ